MFLCFPHLDTLRLALTSGAVPANVSEAPVAAGFDEQDRLWLEPAMEPSRAVLAELRRLGVRAGKSSPVPLDEPLICWQQLLPLQRSAGVPVFSDRTAVLFDLPAAQLAEVVGEMLRLGNDRQSFRCLESGQEPDDGDRVLLRVVGPPYYSLLRALDRDESSAAPVAYVECAPHVWVQAGYRHPLGEQLKPRAGQVLLLRPPRQWTCLDEAPFRDIYEVLEFQLPQAVVSWREGELPRRLTIARSEEHV